jgi:serine/threonine-protein kinase HipA
VSEPSAFVYVELDGVTHRVGRLWVSTKGRETATFEYDADWLADPRHFALEPALPNGPGPYHTLPGRPLFGALGDSAPDRWGRTLLQRAEARRSRTERRTQRTLREIDYLLGVTDVLRQGALRFTAAVDGAFLAEMGDSRVPPLVDLPQLLAASDRVIAHRDSNADLRLLVAPGSSLGGARPKASVRDVDGTLLVAKFSSPSDEIHIVRWEAVALTLAGRAGIELPGWRLTKSASHDVLLLRRFDRRATTRVPYLSAMSLLDAGEGDRRSYVDIAEALRRYGAAPRADLPMLWRRLAFNILVSNLDDHLRNHGVLYEAPGWRLAPAYDLNPVPLEVKPRVLSTSVDIDGDDSASLELALAAAAHFGLRPNQARSIAEEVGRAVRRWRSTAKKLAIPSDEVDRMASAFDSRIV